MAEEKLDFLKREDIRTMAKDLAKLQETAALTEREKIGQLSTATNKEKPIENAVREKLASTMIPKPPRPSTMPTPIPAPPSDSSLLPKTKSSLLEKILVRLFFVFLFFAFLFSIGFGYWYWKTKIHQPTPSVTPTPLIKPNKPTPSLTVSPTPSASASPTVSPTASPETIVPAPLMPMSKTQIIDLLNDDLAQTLVSDLPALKADSQNELMQLAIRKDGRFLNVTEFSQALKMNIPADLMSNLGQQPADFTLFFFNQDNQTRLGLLIKTTDLGQAQVALSAWEKQMETDLDPLFKLMDKTLPALVDHFRDAVYQGMTFRYQTFSKQDLGICYALDKNVLILTGSAQSFKKVIDAQTLIR